jgi:hypothetical protein
MNNLSAREICFLSQSQLSELPKSFLLTFDDGNTVPSTRNKTTYSWHFWEFHRRYAGLPLTSRHCVESVLKNQPLSSETHIELLGRIAEDTIWHFKINSPVDRENINKLIYQITNNVHNKVTCEAEAYVSSIDILDFIEVVDHPTVKQINDSVQPNNDSIVDSYNKILNILKTNEEFSNNNLARAVRSKMVNANQVTQCVAVRGFLTEVDGKILPTPIMSNFTEGFVRLHDYAAESRSAAKSHYFSESPLEDAEYFARRLQLLCMTVERLHYVDCGSTDYIHWLILPPTKDEAGVTTYQGDLAYMAGKYYLDEETGNLKMIRGDDSTLYGKTLKIRSVLGCKHNDKHGVCAVCFGGLSYNLSAYTNLGHICAATMTQQTSQSVLSNKHYQASSVSPTINLSDNTGRFFDLTKEKTGYILNTRLKKMNPTITISRDCLPGLVDLHIAQDVTKINPTRVSNISTIDLCLTDAKGNKLVDTVDLSQGNRGANLSQEFLYYLKDHGWHTDSKNNFVLELTNWNYALPLFKMPDIEYSFSDHSKQVAEIIESKLENLNDRQTPESAVYTLQQLFMLVNAKLNVNIACLEVIIYASMVSEPGTFGLSRGSDKAVMSIAARVMKNRSLSVAFAYQGQQDVILNPASYYKLDRPDSPFDVFVMPHEVLEAERQRRTLTV